MLYIKLLSVVALIVSIGWVIANPSYEPALAVIVSISALISTFIIEKGNKRRAQQHQFISKSSIGIQAGGDINAGDVSNNKHAR